MKTSLTTLDTKVRPFSSDWWDKFLETTNDMKKTAVFKDCMSKTETAVMRDHLMTIIRKLSELRTTEFGYRVFLDGKSVRGLDMEKIYDMAPDKDESFEAWAKRCLPDKKFGMIINRGEKFCPELAQMVSKKIAPLLEEKGIPSLGITFTIFIGNYGWTPIGIHTDAIGENVMHFHLGKGGKSMYTWDPTSYEEMTSERERANNTQIEKYLPYATEYAFGEGDLYFMPEGEYHIGRSDDLSMGLTLWFNNHTKTQLSRKAMRVIIDQFLEESEDILTLDKNSVDDVSLFNPVLDTFNIPDDLEHLNFKEFLKETYRDFRYSIYSNGAFWTRPFPREEDYDFTMDSTIQLLEPYKILTKESIDKQNIHLYVRGTKLVFNNHPCILKFVEKINEGNQIKVSDLNAILDDSWDESICFYILNSIYLYNGISVN